MFTVKERGHVANTHLKIIRQDLNAFLEDKKETEKTTAFLKHSTLGFVSTRAYCDNVNSSQKNFEFALLMNILYP